MASLFSSLQVRSSLSPVILNELAICAVSLFWKKRVVQTLGTLEYVHGLPGFTVKDTELPETDSQWKTILGEP